MAVAPPINLNNCLLHLAKTGAKARPQNLGVEALSGGRKGRFRTMPPCKQGYPQKLIFQFLGVFLTVLSQQPPRKCQVGVQP